MTFEMVIEDVQKIFIEVLGNPGIALERATTADDVEGWDSLTHMELIVAIEKQFNIKFKLSELQRFANVGEMCDNIVDKTSSR
jgi:acyl carrier protein